MKKLALKQKLLALLLLLLFTSRAYTQVLNVPEVIQEQTQWCWAAVSKCILNYYGYSVSQCQIAEYTRQNAQWYYFGPVNCCTDPTQGCNYWNYNYGTSGSIQDILQHWGVQNNGVAYALSTTEITQQLQAHRPFVIRWGWTSGGGHFIVGHGLSGSTLYYMNPWPGEGLKFSTYSWVVSNSDHTWEHTNVLTTNPSAVAEQTPNNSIAIFPQPASDYIMLTLPHAVNTKTTAILHDNAGRLLKTYPLTEQSTRLDIGTLPPGFYILNIISTARNDNFKICIF